MLIYAVNIFSRKTGDLIYSATKIRNFKKRKKKRLKEWITKGFIVSIRRREKLFQIKRKRPVDKCFNSSETFSFAL